MEPSMKLQGSAMLPRFSERTQAIAGEGAAGWLIADAAAEALEQGQDVISLCLGDTSFDTPSRISDAAIRSLLDGRTHYAPVPGIPELRRSIADAQVRFDGQRWTADHVTVFAGAQNALFATIMTIAGAGDEVLCLEPWYATYEASIRASGAIPRPIRIPLQSGDRLTSEQLLVAAVNERTRAILLNSPNNPGGYVFGIDDLQTIASVASRHNLWVISDEVYRTTVFDGNFCSIASLQGMRERTIVINSVSKSHAMTGWRVGWALGPAEASQHLQNVAQCMLFGSPTFVQDATAVALQEAGDVEVTRFADELRRRRDFMCSRLSGIPGLHFLRPEGGMFCFVDVSATGLSGNEFANRLFKVEGLATVPGTAFGPNMRNFIRLSFSGSPEHIAKGLDRLDRFMRNLEGACA